MGGSEQCLLAWYRPYPLPSAFVLPPVENTGDGCSRSHVAVMREKPGDGKDSGCSSHFLFVTALSFQLPSSAFSVPWARAQPPGGTSVQLSAMHVVIPVFHYME